MEHHKQSCVMEKRWNLNFILGCVSLISIGCEEKRKKKKISQFDELFFSLLASTFFLSPFRRRQRNNLDVPCYLRGNVVRRQMKFYGKYIKKIFDWHLRMNMNGKRPYGPIHMISSLIIISISFTANGFMMMMTTIMKCV
jgi:hypothetical protein